MKKAGCLSFKYYCNFKLYSHPYLNF